MKKLLILLAILAIQPPTAASAGTVVISGTDLNGVSVSSYNGAYAASPSGHVHLAYSDPTDDAAVFVKGPFGFLRDLSMSFDYSNLSGGNGNLPYAEFWVVLPDNSLGLILGMGGTPLDDASLIHVANYSGPTYWGQSLGSLLNETYQGVAFGDMTVKYVGVGIGDWPDVGDTGVDIDSITVSSSVPDAGSSLLLLGMSLTGLGAIRRRWR